jgi:hypothetical protein
MDWIALKQSFSKNVREAAKICALGLIMCAYTAPFVPHEHWRYVIEAGRLKRNATQEGGDFNGKSANGVTPLISAASANQLKEVGSPAEPTNTRGPMKASLPLILPRTIQTKRWRAGFG